MTSIEGTIFEDGVYDDVNPSHIIVGNKDYYTSMTYKRTSYIIVIAIALMILFVILLIAFGIFNANDNFRVELEEPNEVKRPQRISKRTGQGADQLISFASPTDGSQLSSHIMCSDETFSKWDPQSSKCLCAKPYWSGNCRRESHKPGFTPIGFHNLNNFEVDIINSFDTQRLSYPKLDQTSCTDACQESCGGVIWESDLNLAPGGRCTLFRTITPTADFKPNPDPFKPSNIYIKDRPTPLAAFKFDNEVVLYARNMDMTSWWEEVDVLLVKKGRRYNLNFFPLYAYNTTQMTGVFARYPFEVSNFQTLANQGTTTDVYVVGPSEQFQVPLEWHSEPIWVMYDFVV